MSKSPAPTRQAAEAALDGFWETVPPLWSHIRGYIRAAAAKNFHLSIEQFQILRLIRSGRGSVSELATAKNISRPAISQAVDGLVNKGLITRKQDSIDRRHVQLALTENGSALLASIFDSNRAWMLSKLEKLSQDQLSDAMQAMQVLKKTFVDF